MPGTAGGSGGRRVRQVGDPAQPLGAGPEGALAGEPREGPDTGQRGGQPVGERPRPRADLPERPELGRRRHPGPGFGGPGPGCGWGSRSLRHQDSPARTDPRCSSEPRTCGRSSGSRAVSAAIRSLRGGAEERSRRQPDPQRDRFVREPLPARRRRAEPAAEPVLQFHRVAHAVPGQPGTQRAEVGVQVAAGLRGPRERADGEQLAVDGAGDRAVQGRHRVGASGDRVGFVEGVRGGRGDGAGDQRARRGEHVEGAGPQPGPARGAGEAEHGRGPPGGQQRAGQVDEYGGPVGEHLGGAEDEGVVRPVHGVAPGLVADDEQPGVGGGLARLAQQLGRRHGRGRVVGDGEQQHARVAALGAHPADGLQQGVRVGYAAALGRGRHVVRPPSQQPDLRGPPSGTRPGQHDVSPVRAEQREQQGGRAGPGGHVLRGGGESAARPVPAGGLPQRLPAARGGSGAAPRAASARTAVSSGRTGRPGSGAGGPYRTGPRPSATVRCVPSTAFPPSALAGHRQPRPLI
ncbi:hypothetical protein GCM10020254_20800 [Streptomyces goshikiensis]